MQRFANDDNITEMMAMWPVSGGDWVMLLPTAETVLVDVDAVFFGEMFASECPAYDDSKGLEQFQTPLEDAEIRAHVTIAQRQVAAARGGRETPDYPSRILGWTGGSLGSASSASPGIAARVRDSFASPGVPNRRVVGRAPPGADEGRVLTGPFSGDAGHVWVVSEPGQALALGVVVRPSRGSVVFKN